MTSSSLIYQILLDFNKPVLAAFFLGELISASYKLSIYYQHTDTFVTEIIILILLAWVEMIRIWMGRKGNLMQRPQAMFLTIFLSIPSALGILYFSKWQTIVLMLDVILAITELIFEGLEAFYAMYWCIAYVKTGRP